MLIYIYMKIALAHINLIPADIDGNLSKVYDTYQKAYSNGCDVIIYPELTTTGYIPGDILNYEWFIKKNIDAVKRFTKSVKKTAAVIGYVDYNKQSWGKPLKNVASFIYQGNIINTVYKKILPFSDIFYEPRYFEQDQSRSKIINFKGKRILITICADIWYDTELLPSPRLSPKSPLDLQQNYDIIINLSASPYHYGKIEKKLKILKDISKKRNIDIIYTNISGANDQIVFDGTSFYISKNGKVFSTKPFKEGVTIIDTENFTHFEPREDISYIKDAIVRGIRDFFNKQNLSKAIIGISGGIDSAVVSCLAVDALGCKNVKGLSLPSKFTSKQSVFDAKKLAKNLLIELDVVPINKIYSTYIKTLKLNEKDIDITIQNIQSRIRANILMAYANKYGYVLLNTSNKSEIAAGYSTMYGDSCGALSPIGDLLKTDIYKLAEYINKDTEIIPKSIIKRIPTAELKPGQKDQDDLPPYEILDEIIRLYVEQKKNPFYIIKRIKDKELVLSTIRRIENNQYKRKQFPPIIKISKNSFDEERKIPIVKKINI